VRPLTRIIIHHSASPLTTRTADIRRWHLDKGWSDIGYHRVIERDGSIHNGRDLDLVGAHTRGFNQDSIGICAVGNNTDSAESWTDAQIDALRKLVAALQLVFGELEIRGHRDLAATLCPGCDVGELL
jgi:N-acetylmuramoyl-L-alanine amidase